MALPVASTTTSSSLVRPRAKPSSPDRVMSTRPCGRSRPSSHTTTSAKVRWMSIPITRFMRLPSVRGHGSGGRHDTYGSALAAQPGGSQGRPATNPSSWLILCIGLPTLRAPGAPQPGWSHHTPGSADPRRARRHHKHHASYEPAGTVEQESEAPGRRGRHLPLRALDHAPDRGGVAGAERRVAGPAPLHAGRRHGRADGVVGRARPGPDPTPGRVTDGHLSPRPIPTTLPDAALLDPGPGLRADDRGHVTHLT